MKHYRIKLILSVVTIAFTCFSSKADSWSDAGNYNISWYTTDADIHISSPEELAGVAYLVNNNFTDFYNQVIHIDADIDLSGKLWIPIGYRYNFRGSIYGHNHSVKGVTLNYFNGLTGFVGKMIDGKIKGLTLEVAIQTNLVQSGLLIAEASRCVFQNLNIIGSISYVNQNISTSTEWSTKIYAGGCVGYASDCTFTDVVSDFTQSLIFGKSSGRSIFSHITLYAGGIVGYGYSKNTYLRCESISNFNNTIYGYNADSYYSTHGGTRVYCGGIVGYDNSSSSTLTSCFGRITNNQGSHPTGVYHHATFYTIGIGDFSGRLQNSVCIVDSCSIIGHEYSWVDAGYHTHSHVSDCGEYSSSSIGGCYINRDIFKTTSKVGGDNQKIFGSSSFTKAQMNTQEFVDELNIYSTLHLSGENNWEIQEGKLTLKHAENKEIYALIFIIDGTVYHTDSLAYGEDIKLPETPYKEGHIFTGWSDVPKTMPAHDVVVHGTFTPSTSINNIIYNGCDKVQKLIKDKQLLIIRDGNIYNAQGLIIKNNQVN